MQLCFFHRAVLKMRYTSKMKSVEGTDSHRCHDRHGHAEFAWTLNGVFRTPTQTFICLCLSVFPFFSVTREGRVVPNQKISVILFAAEGHFSNSVLMSTSSREDFWQANSRVVMMLKKKNKLFRSVSENISSKSCSQTEYPERLTAFKN